MIAGYGGRVDSMGGAARIETPGRPGCEMTSCAVPDGAISQTTQIRRNGYWAA
jgi:hypothetical protein